MDPKETARKAARVARADTAHVRAIDEVGQAYHILLCEILEAVRPALDALCSPLHFTQVPRSGLQLVRGDHGDLYWMDDCTFILLKRDGTHSPSSSEDLFRLYGGNGVVDAMFRISVALEAQLHGKKPRASEKALRQAEQIRALATVARGLS